MRDTDNSNADIMQAIGRLEGALTGAQASVTDMETRLGKIEQAAAWGRGAVWGVIKFGIVISALPGGAAWLWERIGD